MDHWKFKSKYYVIFFIIYFIICVLLLGCGSRSENLIKNSNEFGIKSAKMGLWDEAIMRWSRIIEMEPDNAKAHNNLGVAYEAKGELDSAMVEYKKAMEIEPKNSMYKQNYKKLKVYYEKINR